MGFLDEFKRLAHPYEDEEDDDFEEIAEIVPEMAEAENASVVQDYEGEVSDIVELD